MEASFSIRCACGKVRGSLVDPAWANRVVCYCPSCQAFPKRLGRAQEVLDERGGTDIVQTSPGHLTFSQGTEHLACLRITAKGPLRWYASCCNWPIGNTLSTAQVSFISLLGHALGDAQRLDEVFGPPRLRVFTEFAQGDPKPEKHFPKSTLVAFLGRMAAARLSGAWRQTPFFDAAGKPVADPADSHPEGHGPADPQPEGQVPADRGSGS